MKFYRKDFDVDREWIMIIPTIVIRMNNPIYFESNVAIEFHWLTLHVRFMWMKKVRWRMEHD